MSSPLPNSAHGDELISAKRRGIDRILADGRTDAYSFGCAARAGARGTDLAAERAPARGERTGARGTQSAAKQ